MIGTVFRVLIAIVATVVCYWLIVWVLKMVGITIPEQLLVAVMVLIGLLACYSAIQGTSWASGWWTRTP